MVKNGGLMFHKRKVLIIEDNETNREMLSALLEDEFDILTACNGLEGLKILSDNYRDLSVIFLDVQMPVCNGYQFLEKTRSDALLSTVPVIITTGSDDTEEELKCLDMGASDFVSKPYNPKLVLARAKSIIKLHESEAALSAIEYDGLTGVYTMPAFYHHAEAMVLSNPDKCYDLFASDVHEFKLLNSVYGEKVGDEILIFLAKLYSEYHRDGLIARSGDKFYCMYPSDHRLSRSEIAEVQSRAENSAPVPNLTINCGVYLDIDTSKSISLLCDRVQMAIASIKHNVTKNLVYYDDAVQRERIRQQQMEAEFEDALRREEFVVFYQPKVDIHTEKIIAAEALVRWKTKGGQMIVPPGDFIPLFEGDGLIHYLDEYVFKKVCDFQMQRISQKKYIVPISVNLSRSSVYHSETLSNYINILTEYNVDRRYVPIELTESAAIEGHKIVSLTKSFVNAGFSLHMDDFGSGYSSIANLGSIPFDMLKLDKSLVDQIGSERGDVIVRHTIMIAQELGMKVVAEGVENSMQLEFLRGAGCDMIQGFYYSLPQNSDNFTKMLDDNLPLMHRNVC